MHGSNNSYVSKNKYATLYNDSQLKYEEGRGKVIIKYLISWLR
jgi:hypothetical protein